MEYSPGVIDLPRRLATFLVTIYYPHFLMCSRGVDAAINDLELWQKVEKYKEKDKEIACFALEKLELHLWYMTPPLAIWGLYSDKLEYQGKVDIAAKLLKFTPPEDDNFNKPEFPSITQETKLIDLITEDSYRFFKILGLNNDWLKEEPLGWDLDPDYCEAMKFVNTAKVCNDTCERAIKLGSDYSQILTKDNTMRNNILQAVEAERKMYPGSLKSTLNNRI